MYLWSPQEFVYIYKHTASSTPLNGVDCIWISTAWVMWSELFFFFSLYAQCNYVKGHPDFGASSLDLFNYFDGMQYWSLAFNHFCSCCFALSLSNCLLLVLKMLLHADCIAPGANKCTPQENLSDLVNPLYWYTWSKFSLMPLELTDAFFVVLGCRCTKWVPTSYIISKFDHTKK